MYWLKVHILGWLISCRLCPFIFQIFNFLFQRRIIIILFSSQCNFQLKKLWEKMDLTSSDFFFAKNLSITILFWESFSTVNLWMSIPLATIVEKSLGFHFYLQFKYCTKTSTYVWIRKILNISNKFFRSRIYSNRFPFQRFRAHLLYWMEIRPKIKLNEIFTI